MAASKADYWPLIVDGYVRLENKIFCLNIPADINGIIFMFYKDAIRYFEKYRKR